MFQTKPPVAVGTTPSASASIAKPRRAWSAPTATVAAAPRAAQATPSGSSDGFGGS